MKYFFLLFMILGFSGCSYSVNKKAATATESMLQQKGVSGYDGIASQIIAPNCLNCHSNASGNKGGLNLETYESVKLKLNQIYLRSVEIQDMPPGGLEASARESLKIWIENGASRQASVGQMDFKGALLWKDVKSKILQKKCLDCHSAPEPEAQLDLANYDVFKSKIELIFNRVFVKQDMPLAPYPSLSAAEKNALLKWISQGLPQ